MGQTNAHGAICPYQCQMTAEYSCVTGMQASVWYRQMYSTAKRKETGELKQQHQENLRVSGQKEENMSLKLFESDEFLLPCWSLADHNLHVIESAVLIPVKKSGENSTITRRNIFLCHKVSLCIRCTPPKKRITRWIKKDLDVSQWSQSSGRYSRRPSQGQLNHKPSPVS